MTQNNTRMQIPGDHWHAELLEVMKLAWKSQLVTPTKLDLENSLACHSVNCQKCQVQLRTHDLEWQHLANSISSLRGDPEASVLVHAAAKHER